MAKPVIVIAAYGTGEPDAMKSLENIDAMVQKRFPGHEVRWTLIAKWLLARFRKEGRTTMFARGMPIKDLTETYNALRTEGKTAAVVQCLLVHDGTESDHVLKTPAPAGLAVKYGLPLLSKPENLEATVKAESAQFGKDDTAAVLIGHGADDDIRINKPFLTMDEYVRKHYRNVYAACIHGPPKPDTVFAEIRAAGLKSVVFVPLMITTSEHILHEVVAETPESWKNRLGLPARLGPSFADTPPVMEIYLNSIGEALGQL